MLSRLFFNPNQRCTKKHRQIFTSFTIAGKDAGFHLHKARVFERVDPVTGNVLKVKRGKSRKLKFVQTMKKGELLHPFTVKVIEHCSN